MPQEPCFATPHGGGKPIGGFLDAVIIDPEPLAEVNDLECEEGAPLVLPRHKVLKASFRLDSKAFMLT